MKAGGPATLIQPGRFLRGGCFFIAITCSLINAGVPVREAESIYLAIRTMTLDTNEALNVTAKTCQLKRDVGILSFHSGTIFFFEEILGRRCALYFSGNGTLSLHPENPLELQQIQRFTGEAAPVLTFDQIYIIFTDSTYEQLIAQQRVDAFEGAPAAGKDARALARERFLVNSDARILENLLDRSTGSFFKAYMHCPAYGDLVFTIDPMRYEQVTLQRYRSERFQRRAEWETWYSTYLQDDASPAPGSCDMTDITIDVAIDEKQSLSARAEVTFTCLLDGIQCVPLDLAPMLRIEHVLLGSGDTCGVIQEEEKMDAQAWLIFPEPLRVDSVYSITCTYSGERVVDDLGGGNFAVNERTRWYPTFYGMNRDAAHFRVVFAVPDGLTLLGTGELVRTWTNGGYSYSEWQSIGECTHAGFNFGKYSQHTEKSALCSINCFTNKFLSDDLNELRRMVEGSKSLQADLMMLPQELTTDNMGKNAAIESQNAYSTFVHFFGAIPTTEIRVSQQPQTSYAQSWPALIYLPFTSFLRKSVRERLGLVFDKESVLWYETLASHEMAHQWWGHAIMTGSYHDQWLEEGFATYAEALYLQMTEGTNQFREFMESERKKIIGKVAGKRASELGPIWLGSRLSSLDAPQGRLLMYAKGAYVLHMLRMMFFDYGKKSDERFITMMKDFTRTFIGQRVTLADFKMIAERHWGQSLAWFFNQWVFGTEIPIYRIKHKVNMSSEGKYIMTITATQEGVSSDFTMPLPIVVNFADGHAVVSMLMKGTEPLEKKFSFSVKPESIEPNPWNAVLCEISE